MAGWCVRRMVSYSSWLSRLRSNLQGTDITIPPFDFLKFSQRVRLRSGLMDDVVARDDQSATASEVTQLCRRQGRLSLPSSRGIRAFASKRALRLRPNTQITMP